MFERKALLLTGILCVVAPLTPTLAETFRCGQHLVREGMSTVAIKKRCGEPQSVERTQEPIIGRRSNGTAYEIGIATRELWTYELGKGRFPARVTIEEGVATRIELLAEL